ncbi:MULTISPECIES: acyltransferase [Providencia]|uniref:acyltransferase n=1 Tax=Providencia TaxID=586 RepID=UPI0008398111|nr:MULTISPECIES: acyltransferase [Providencia]MBP6123089.1 N-acetyltransferase [Providencia sp.]NIH20839.1 N-acetyltransferase [Providencia heimbachae]
MKISHCAIRDVVTGTNIHIVEPVNLYECTINDNVFIGPFVEIQKNCHIGPNSRIQSHSFICENVTIGENCLIGHNVTFVNDLFKGGAPDADSENWLTITIEDNVTIGSGAIILCAFICQDAVIGAGSVVVKPITQKGIYAGNPAKLLRTL